MSHHYSGPDFGLDSHIDGTRAFSTWPRRPLFVARPRKSLTPTEKGLRPRVN
jgi:hypothetical protein